MRNLSRALFWLGFSLLVAGLVIGILDREWTRFFFKNIYLDRQIVVGFHLFITHGHIFMFSLFSFVLALLFREQSQVSSTTMALFWVYVIGVIATLGLGLYKGLALSAMVGMDPRIGLFHADKMLFGGNSILRSLLYTLAHSTMGAGLIGLFIKASKPYQKNPH
ncbi:hypothetical protein [Thermospira aquatica]|uniref:DUF2871 domain-containing protein n=1 Tax=Thermospira aquatica TaxID=2828656 RepID=A0AAX3BD51_9SPIR|nr:hypothetical protein [Thermospira aquatica]URA10060.1 hypothetical protein KDW03_11345 [Thermospira aquatica]